MTTPKKEPITLLPFIKSARSKLFFLAQFLLGLTLFVCIFIVCQSITSRFNISLPPALLGIGLLLSILLIAGIKRKTTPNFIAAGARPMLSHMVLFLIPAIVGVVAHLDLILAFPLVLFLAIVVTTVLSLFITAYISQKLMGGSE